MRKLIALEPEVYEKLKHEAPDKKVLSDLDRKMQEILQSNKPDSEKVTLYNEALQKSKLFLKKSQPKTPVKKPLSDKVVLKQYKKRAGVKKLLKEAKSKKNLDWDADGQMVLDNRVVPGSNIKNLFQSALKKRNPILPGVREFESLLCESIVRLLRSEKSGSFSGSRHFPKQWLQSQDTYTLHKPVRKKFKRRKTIVPGAHFQMQADLVDFSLLKLYNDNYKYILVVVDVFSKKAFIAYLKTKSSSDMIEAFERVMSKTDKFQKLQTDMGREFLNRPFQSWLKQHRIEHFHTPNFDTTATIAERFIRTLKERLWR